jgi:hypothetical protein
MSALAVLALGEKKDEKRFAPGPASSYSSKQTAAGVTIAAVPYVTDEMAQSAFGKRNPYHYGILPILVIIQNDSAQALKLDRMQVEYSVPGGTHIEPTPVSEVASAASHPKRPDVQSPLPRLPGGKKGPLANWEIEGRAFAARLLPPHDSANGFFYFQTMHRAGAKIYITGITEASSGKDLFYFEIPLDDKSE